MAKITILRNGETVKTTETTLECMKTILTTKSPVEGVASAVSTLGKGNPDAYIASFAAGNPADVFEVHIEDEYAGKSSREKLVKFMTLACHPETWMNELPKGERKSKDKGEAEVL